MSKDDVRRLVKEARRHSAAFLKAREISRDAMAARNPLYGASRAIKLTSGPPEALPKSRGSLPWAPYSIRADRLPQVASASMGRRNAELAVEHLKDMGLDPRMYRFRGVIPPDRPIRENEVARGFSVRRSDRFDAWPGVKLDLGGKQYSGYPGRAERAYGMIPLPTFSRWRDVNGRPQTHVDIASLRRGRGPTYDAVLSDRYLQKAPNGRVLATRDEPVGRELADRLHLEHGYDFSTYNAPDRAMRMLQSKLQGLLNGGRRRLERAYGTEAVRQAPAGRTDDVGTVVLRADPDPYFIRDGARGPVPSLVFTRNGAKSGVDLRKLRPRMIRKADSRRLLDRGRESAVWNRDYLLREHSPDRYGMSIMTAGDAGTGGRGVYVAPLGDQMAEVRKHMKGLRDWVPKTLREGRFSWSDYVDRMQGQMMVDVPVSRLKRMLWLLNRKQGVDLPRPNA